MKYVIIQFFHTWCKPVQEVIIFLGGLVTENKANPKTWSPPTPHIHFYGLMMTLEWQSKATECNTHRQSSRYWHWCLFVFEWWLWTL